MLNIVIFNKHYIHFRLKKVVNIVMYSKVFRDTFAYATNFHKEM